MNTYDYLATSSQIEFRAQRLNDLKRTNVIFEQIQNLYSLYKSKPRYGPESCEECIEVMSHLRPTEDYIDSAKSELELDNLGPARTRESIPTGRFEGASQSSRGDKSDPVDDEQLAARDNFGQELTDYCTKLTNYLDDRPVEHDREVIYSKGKFDLSCIPCSMKGAFH